ncbi:SnoaL-like domain-containing protein [Colwellia chukchiensis]|uniref:SnoaL-like domain-containing protein n=1 Tax=Colwellia chukchiensis TaxID=641665 RepID=A0A1H7MQT2_9GAMM|nr:nuclear transport factor 2 family protein [Colwellia chukchiensis]SEL13650.1 SnoaL-like domain-containing protein [Colwellia chukchiensis]
MIFNRLQTYAAPLIFTASILTALMGCSFSALANSQSKSEASQAVHQGADQGKSLAAKNAINQVLDGLHEAASKTDLDTYLGSFTNTGVFMGTDDWERWSRPETLDKYVAERFAGGTGWSYKSVERHINFSPEQNIAWFDEITVSEKWGRFRGTGVLINHDGKWKIAHYAMSALVPNEAWEKVADINIKAFAERQKNNNPKN